MSFTRSAIVGVATGLSLGIAVAASIFTAAAQGLPQEARVKAEANFKAANASGTGTLTPAEFKVFLDRNAAAGVGRSQMVVGRKLYDSSFAGADKNKDGGVSLEEYLAVQDETQD